MTSSEFPNPIWRNFKNREIGAIFGLLPSLYHKQMSVSNGGGSSRKDDGYIFEQQNDVRLNDLGSKISALKNITIDIHQDVNEQDRHLNESQGIFDGFGNSLQNSFGRMNRMVSKRHQRQLCYYISIALVVFFVLYYGSGLISWSTSSSNMD